MARASRRRAPGPTPTTTRDTAHGGPPGYLATSARFAALSTSTQHHATRYGRPCPMAIASRSASATLRSVERAPPPTSSKRFQISRIDSSRATSSRSARSAERSGSAGRVASSKRAVRVVRAQIRSRASCASRCPASLGCGLRSRAKAIPSGRPRTMPSRTHTMSGVPVAKPRSISLIRDCSSPTRWPSSRCVQRRRRRERAHLTAQRGRDVPCLAIALHERIAPSPSVHVELRRRRARDMVARAARPPLIQADAHRCERYLGRFVGIRLVEAALAIRRYVLITLDPAGREARTGCRAADEVAERAEVTLTPLRTPHRSYRYAGAKCDPRIDGAGTPGEVRDPRIARTGTSARSSGAGRRERLDLRDPLGQRADLGDPRRIAGSSASAAATPSRSR